MHLNFDDFYILSMVCLKCNGAHPSVARNLKWALHFALTHGYFLGMNIMFGYNLIFINLKENDFSNVCSHGIFLTIYVVVTSKYCVLLWYQDTLNTMIKYNQEYFDEARLLSEENQQIVYNYAKRGRGVSYLWLKSTIITMLMFPLKGLLGTIYVYYSTGEVKLYPFSETVFPFGLDKNKDRFDVFCFCYFLDFVFALYCIFMYVGFTPLGPIFILNACAQIELVTKEVEVMFDKEEYNKEESARNIKRIILKIQNIYSFVDHINDMFKVLYELCLKAAAIMIPVTCFLIIETLKDGEISLDYIMFTYTASLLCFIPCLYSDLLMEKGEDLRIAIYASGWETFFDSDIRKTLLIMLIRSVRPISISTVFRTVNLDAFSELCHQAYAIFNLLCAAVG